MEHVSIENIIIDCGLNVFNLPEDRCLIFREGTALTGVYILSYGNPESKVRVFVDQMNRTRPMHFPDGLTLITWRPLDHYPLWIKVSHRADNGAYDFTGRLLMDTDEQAERSALYKFAERAIASDRIQYTLAAYFSKCEQVPESIRISYEYNLWLWYWLDPGLQLMKNLTQSHLFLPITDPTPE
jgi:hypothetical protein